MNLIMNLLAQSERIGVTEKAVEATELTGFGWVIMILALGGMCSLLGWCIYKVVTVPHPEEHMHTQADITPPDEIEERQ